MWELTESSAWVGWMAASSTLPILFLALAAGALADMFDRTRVMLTAQAIMGTSAALMAITTALGVISPSLLLGLGLLLGSGLALNIPAWQALVPELVPRGLIASAVALQSAAFNAARAVGPALGGFIVLVWGPQAGFAFNAATYAAVVVILFVVGPQLAAREVARSSMRHSIADGFAFTRRTQAFNHLLALLAIFAVTSFIVQAILPVHTAHLGGSEAAYGLLLGAMGLGALFGAGFRQRLLDRLEKSSVPYTIITFGLASVFLGLAPNLWVAWLAMFLAGLSWLLTLATLNATAQLLAPDVIRGRVMSFYTMSFAGFIPIGAILGGMVADQTGTSQALIIFAVGTLTLGLAAPRFRFPRLADLEAAIEEV